MPPPAPVVVEAAASIVLGLPRVADMPLDVFPEFAPPPVEIQTEVPGLSAVEVEASATAPIEGASDPRRLSRRDRRAVRRASARDRRRAR